VVVIEEEAFMGNKLTSVNIPDSVTVIGESAFAENNITRINMRTSINIDKSVFENNFSAFYYANRRRIGTYTYSDGSWSVEYDINENGIMANIKNGNSIQIVDYNGTEKAITIPSTMQNLPVTEIGERAFYDKGLTDVIIPNSVTTIKQSAFDTNALTSVNIPNSVKEIHMGAFIRNKLTNINFSNNLTRISSSVFYGNELNSVTIPNGVNVINEWAFAHNQLTSVTIPDSVAYVEYKAFEGNPITEIKIGAFVTISRTPTDNGFADFYYDNNQMAGTYLLIDSQWQFTALSDEENAVALADIEEALSINPEDELIIRNREKLLANDYFKNKPIIADDNTPLPSVPEGASDYLHTWRFISISQTCTITITPTEFHYRSTFGDGYEYKLTDLVWEELIRPDDAFRPYIGFETDNYKGAAGYAITGTVNYIFGNWRERNTTRTEYVFLRADDKEKMLNYTSGTTNHEFFKIR
jgi:hypothetical protein